MCDIYRNATLTIAALGATRATDGMFARRDPLIFQGCRYYRTWNQRNGRSLGHSAPSVVNQYSCFFNSVLNSRGWAFQERALSRRTLYFGSSLFWECDSVSEKEADANHGALEAHFKALVYPEMEDGGVLQQLHQKDGFESPEPRTLLADPLLKKWAKILFDFTGRRLTFPSDRVPAIAGLITHYSERTRREKGSSRPKHTLMNSTTPLLSSMVFHSNYPIWAHGLTFHQCLMSTKRRV
jgi:hypothetical protein